MATKLILHETKSTGQGVLRDMLAGSQGPSLQSGVVTEVASGTQIQWTKTAGGEALEWVSGRVPSGGFTLSGTMTFNLWAKENNTNNNCGVRARVFKRDPTGTETEIGSGYNFGSPTELTTTMAVKNWTGAPTSTAFNEDDRIVVRFYIINVGTMGSQTSTCDYDGTTGGSDGDSFFQINENVTFKAEAQFLDDDSDPAGSGFLGQAMRGAGALMLAGAMLTAAIAQRVATSDQAEIVSSPQAVGPGSGEDFWIVIPAPPVMRAAITDDSDFALPAAVS
jgi:hypothetical protein